MQVNSENLTVYSEEASWISGFLFALTRFGKNPQRFSAGAQIYRLTDSNLSHDFLEIFNAGASDQDEPLATLDSLIEHVNGYKQLDETLTNFLAKSITDDNLNKQDNLGLAVWYIIETINNLAGRIGTIYSAKLTIGDSEGECIFVKCHQNYIALQLLEAQDEK